MSKLLEERVSKWVKLLEIPQEEIMKNVNKAIENYKSKGLNEVDAERRALIKVRNDYRKAGSAFSGLKIFTGFFTGLGREMEIVSMMARKASKIYNDDPDSAVAQGITNEAGEALDTREKVNFQPNPNFGRLLNLNETSYVRRFYGVVKQDNTYLPFTLYGNQESSGDLVKNFAPPLFEVVEFTSGIGTKNNPDGSLRLNLRKNTEVKSIDEKMKIEEVIRNAYRIISVENVPERYNPKDYNCYCIEGSVVDFDAEPNPFGTRRVYIGDEGGLLEDEDVLLGWIPDHVPITFKVNDVVLTFGTWSKSNNKYSMNMFGLYPIFSLGEKVIDEKTSVVVEEDDLFGNEASTS